jgi:hypothetical protein
MARHTALKLIIEVRPAPHPGRGNFIGRLPVVPLPLHHRLISRAPPAQNDFALFSGGSATAPPPANIQRASGAKRPSSEPKQFRRVTSVFHLHDKRGSNAATFSFTVKPPSVPAVAI